MKLVYWYIPRLDDADCYSIRARTKKEALARKQEILDGWGSGGYRPEFGPIEKIVLQYRDGFQLMDECLGEDRGITLQIN